MRRRRVDENAEDIFGGYLWMRTFLHMKFLAAHAKAEIFSSARISDTIEVCFFVSVVLSNQYQ
jgi:hypothetical protein